MPVRKRGADLAVRLEAANAGTMPGARIDDHIGTLFGIDGHAVRRNDLKQQIVDRPRQRAAVDHDVVVIGQHRRAVLGGVPLVVSVADLAHDVEEEHRALREIGRVDVPVLQHLGRAALLRPDVAQRRRGLLARGVGRGADLFRMAGAERRQRLRQRRRRRHARGEALALFAKTKTLERRLEGGESAGGGCGRRGRRERNLVHRRSSFGSVKSLRSRRSDVGRASIAIRRRPPDKAVAFTQRYAVRRRHKWCRQSCRTRRR